MFSVFRKRGPVEPKVVADAKAAAEWIAEALSSSGYRADFSLESLREVDRFFDEHAPDGQPLPEGLLSSDVGERLFALGGYVGEVIRRACGGEWEGSDEDPRAEVNIALKLASGAML